MNIGASSRWSQQDSLRASFCILVKDFKNTFNCLLPFQSCKNRPLSSLSTLKWKGCWRNWTGTRLQASKCWERWRSIATNGPQTLIFSPYVEELKLLVFICGLQLSHVFAKFPRQLKINTVKLTEAAMISCALYLSKLLDRSVPQEVKLMERFDTIHQPQWLLWARKMEIHEGNETRKWSKMTLRTLFLLLS